MSYKPFEVSESEAFLLGAVFGEYSQSRRRRMRELLQCRLLYFVPDLSETRLVPLLQLPPDATPNEDFSGTYGNAAYPSIVSLEHGTWLGIAIDTSRRSLLDIVLGYLEEEQAIAVPAALADPLTALDKTNDDDRERVTLALTRLILENNAKDPYEAGRVLGELLSMAGDSVGYLMWCHLQDESCAPGFPVPRSHSFEERRLQLMQQLSENPAIKKLDATHHLLSAEMERCCQCLDGADEDCLPQSIRDEDFLSAVIDSVPPLWLLVGTIHRALQSQGDDRSGARLSRAFMTKPATSIPNFRATMHLVERVLHSPSTGSTPAEIVTLLVSGIEPMVKALWPDRFVRVARTAAPNTPTAVLQEKERSGTESERRFAQIALRLWSSYRNDAIHERQVLHTYVKSWSEALFVHSGMRLLLELFEELKLKS